MDTLVAIGTLRAAYGYSLADRRWRRVSAETYYDSAA